MSSQSNSSSGSVKLTVIKTSVTVGLTIILTLLLRELLFSLPYFDTVSGGHFGASVLHFLVGNGGATQQKVVVTGLLLLCFLGALFLVWLGQLMVKRSRK